jgi:hypothetical protein
LSIFLDGTKPEAVCASIGIDVGAEKPESIDIWRDPPLANVVERDIRLAAPSLDDFAYGIKAALSLSVVVSSHNLKFYSRL